MFGSFRLVESSPVRRVENTASGALPTKANYNTICLQNRIVERLELEVDKKKPPLLISSMRARSASYDCEDWTLYINSTQKRNLIFIPQNNIHQPSTAPADLLPSSPQVKMAAQKIISNVVNQ